MKYRIVIGQTQTDVEILPGPDSLFTVQIGGKTHVAEVQHVDGAEIFSLLYDGQSWEFLAQRDKSNYNIIIHGHTYAARVFEGALAAMDQMPSPVHDLTEQALVSPMPGVVVDVPVSPDEEVRQGAPLVVIESMKMNNPLKAPRDARVKSVAVTKGQRVNKGDVLVVIE